MIHHCWHMKSIQKILDPYHKDWLFYKTVFKVSLQNKGSYILLRSHDFSESIRWLHHIYMNQVSSFSNWNKWNKAEGRFLRNLNYIVSIFNSRPSVMK